MSTRATEYALKHSNGTYYRGPSAIGPVFGATRKDAARFASKQEAELCACSHPWAFVMAKAVKVPALATPPVPGKEGE